MGNSLQTGVPWSSLDGFAGCREFNILKPMIVVEASANGTPWLDIESRVANGSPDIRYKVVKKIREAYIIEICHGC